MFIRTDNRLINSDHIIFIALEQHYVGFQPTGWCVSVKVGDYIDQKSDANKEILLYVSKDRNECVAVLDKVQKNLLTNEKIMVI